jgi:hypothetical protein
MEPVNGAFTLAFNLIVLEKRQAKIYRDGPIRLRAGPRKTGARSTAKALTAPIVTALGP